MSGLVQNTDAADGAAKLEAEAVQVDPQDFDNMTDADFLQLDSAAAGIGMPDVVTGSSPTLEDKLDAAPQKGAADGEADEADEAGDTEDKSETTKEVTGDAAAKPAEKAAEAAVLGDEEKASDAAPTEPGAAATEGAPQDFEALYKQIMRPFKANGKEFTPASPDEAVRLMQMGANYTKKMQTLAPTLKLMRMLENNGLLEEGKLNFLIDLDKKTPAAIAKLLHDGKIDPLDLDTSSEPTYTPGNHAVSDQEMAFHDVLGTVMQTPAGKETVSAINSGWDHASKQAIYKEPELLAIINEQRSNGIYAKISGEIDRRRTLGEFQNTPFISAYKQVGDELHQAGKLHPMSASPQGNPAPAPAARPVLDTRPAVRKPAVTNGEQARAISPAPKAAPKAAAASFDPFEMTDEQIMQIRTLKV